MTPNLQTKMMEDARARASFKSKKLRRWLEPSIEGRVSSHAVQSAVSKNLSSKEELVRHNTAFLRVVEYTGKYEMLSRTRRCAIPKARIYLHMMRWVSFLTFGLRRSENMHALQLRVAARAHIEEFILGEPVNQLKRLPGSSFHVARHQDNPLHTHLPIRFDYYCRPSLCI
jgi:hypothetical protein